MIVAAFRKPPVFLKSNTVTHFKNYLTFPASSPAYGTFYKITGCFMDAATVECKICWTFGKISKITKRFHRSKQKLKKVLFLAINMPKKFLTICDHTESTDI
jgi:hypothetical protein